MRAGWWRWGRVELPVQSPSTASTTSVSDHFRQPRGRRSAPCLGVQSRAPRSGLSPDYATLIRSAAPLNDASAARGTGAVSTLTLPPKRRGRESTACWQVLRFAAGLTRPGGNLGSRPLTTRPCRDHASPRVERLFAFERIFYRMPARARSRPCPSRRSSTAIRRRCARSPSASARSSWRVAPDAIGARAAGLAAHRLRPADPAERRVLRLDLARARARPPRLSERRRSWTIPDGVMDGARITKLRALADLRRRADRGRRAARDRAGRSRLLACADRPLRAVTVIPSASGQGSPMLVAVDDCRPRSVPRSRLSTT